MNQTHNELLILASAYLALSCFLELPVWQQQAIKRYFSILSNLESIQINTP